MSTTTTAELQARSRLKLAQGSQRAVTCPVSECGDPSRQHSMNPGNEVCPTTSNDHFALDIKGSYSVKAAGERVLERGDARPGHGLRARDWQGGGVGETGRKSAKEGRGCLRPTRSALPAPTPPPVYRQKGRGQVICLKVYFSQVESWKVSI